jgi:protein TonB
MSFISAKGDVVMNAIRGPFSIAGGALFAGALFVGLGHLVNVPFEASPSTPVVKLDFTSQIVDSKPVNKRDPKPEREPPTYEPGPPRIGGGETGPEVQVVRIVGPKIETGPGRDRIIMSGVDTEVIPRVRVNPEYPPSALTKNIEGWVQVRFTVTAIGTVRDPVIVASEPRTVFDEAALKAIARWRYNPRVENGEAVERVGLQTVIRFKLDN